MSIFDEEFVFLALGAWVAIQVTLLGAIWPNVSLTTRRTLGIGIAASLVSLTSLWCWAFLSKGNAEGEEWLSLLALVMLPISFAAFMAGILGKGGQA